MKLRAAILLLCLVAGIGVGFGAFYCAKSSQATARENQAPPTIDPPPPRKPVTMPATMPTGARGVEEFGYEEGPLLHKGFIFIDGKYIKPPYKFARYGPDIYVNNILYSKNEYWPMPSYDKVTADINGLPPGLRDDMTCEQMRSAANDAINQKENYLRSPRNMRNPYYKTLEEYYKKLPYVARVEVEDEGDLMGRLFIIHMKNGKIGDRIIYGGGGYLWGESGIFWDERQVYLHAGMGEVTEMSTSFAHYRDTDGCDMIVGADDYKNFDAEETALKLPLILDIMRSDRSQRQKLELLVRMDILPSDRLDEMSSRDEIFLSYFSADSPELDARLKTLAKELNVTPMTYADLPPLPDRSHLKRLLQPVSSQSLSPTTLPATSQPGGEK